MPLLRGVRINQLANYSLTMHIEQNEHDIATNLREARKHFAAVYAGELRTESEHLSTLKKGTDVKASNKSEDVQVSAKLTIADGRNRRRLLGSWTVHTVSKTRLHQEQTNFGCCELPTAMSATIS